MLNRFGNYVLDVTDQDEVDVLIDRTHVNVTSLKDCIINVYNNCTIQIYLSTLGYPSPIINVFNGKCVILVQDLVGFGWNYTAYQLRK